MLKFERRYRAEFIIGNIDENGVETPEEAFIIEYPFTCQFTIDLGIYSSSNRASFQFFNLSKDIQAKMWLDIFNYGKKYVDISFYAGYKENLVLCFSGRALQCSSYRNSGDVNFITELSAINAVDFFRFGYLNKTFTQGTTFEEIIANVLAETGIKPGYITPEINVPIPRDKTFIGQTIDLLGREYGGYNIFVNNNELNIIGDNDVIPGEILVITDSSGLLGSPIRANVYTEIEMVFEPQLVAGQAVEVLSESMPNFNRAYKVIKIRHSGVISPRVSGKLTTRATLTMADEKLRELKKTKDLAYTGKATNGIWEKPVEGIISSPFGLRMHPIEKKEKFHSGMDIAAPLDTPVYAPANGLVIFSGWNGGYGKAIELDNGEINGKRVSSLFGHLNNWIVESGQTVNKGEIIGYVGNSGNSTGSHLHFGVRENGKPVNPTIYIGNYG